MDISNFTIDCTGDVVVGDIILFEENVWEGPYKRPKLAGTRKIIAKVINDSYGELKQQHTFTLRVIESCGYCSLTPNKKVCRKGRVIYRNETRRLPWNCSEDRELKLEEKHCRGDKAREQRDIRKYGTVCS